MDTANGSQMDRLFMQRAIELAQTVSEAAVSPNPRVGALIVEAGVIVSEGYHAQDGGPMRSEWHWNSLDAGLQRGPRCTSR